MSIIRLAGYSRPGALVSLLLFAEAKVEKGRALDIGDFPEIAGMLDLQ